MKPHLAYVSRNDPDYFIVAPTHLDHQALADFYWSASDDGISLAPRPRRDRTGVRWRT